MATKREEAQIDVIINGEKANASVDEMEKGVKQLRQEWRKLPTDTEEYIKKTEQLKKAEKRLDDVKKAAKGVQQETAGILDEMEKLGPAGSMLSNLKGGFTSLISTVGNVVKSLFTLSGAMTAIPIFALIAAVTALIAYFKSTDEGADMLERTMARVGAVVDIVVAQFAKLGRFIVEAIKNPKQTLIDFVDFLKNNLINRLNAFAVIMDGISKGDFKKVTNGVIQLGTGIENATAKAVKLKNALGETIDQAVAASNAAAKIVKDSQDLEDREIDIIAKNKERQGLIDELMLKYKDESLTRDQRLAGLKKAGEIEKQMSKEAIEIALARLDIERRKNDEIMKAQGLDNRHDVGGENYKREQEALAKVIELRNQSAALRQQIANRESKFIKEQNDEREKALKDEEKLNEEVRKRIHQLEVNLLGETIEDKKQKLREQADEELRAVIGNEEQKAVQTKLINDKLQKDLVAIEDTYREEQKKKEEQANKEIFEELKRDALAYAEYNVELSKNDSEAYLDAKKLQLEIEQGWELQNKELTENEKLLIEEKYREQREELEEEARQRKLEKEKEVADIIGNTLTTVIQTVEEFAKINSDKQLSRINKEKEQRIASLDNSLEKGRISEQKYAKLKERAEEEARKKEAAIKNKQAKTEKQSNIVQAIIATALSIVKALPNLPLSILAGVMGAAQVAKIVATPLPTFKLGDWLGRAFSRGKSLFNGLITGSKHGATYGTGGIVMYDRLTGQEKGELQGNEIILTDGVARNPQLRAEASRLNVLGGGRSFADGGPIASDTGTLNTNSSTFSNEQFLNKLDLILAAVIGLRNIVFKGHISLTEFEAAQKLMEDIRTEAKL